MTGAQILDLTGGSMHFMRKDEGLLTLTKMVCLLAFYDRHRASDFCVQLYKDRFLTYAEAMFIARQIDGGRPTDLRKREMCWEVNADVLNALDDGGPDAP